MNWIEALKAWNAKHGGKYTIPRKGTKEHAEVVHLMHKMGEMHHSRASPKEHHSRASPKAHAKPETFIQEVVSHMKKGAMTKTALRHHETPLEYAKEVLAHPEKHTLTMRRRAQFLINIQKKRS